MAVFGVNSSLPPLIDRLGRLVLSADKRPGTVLCCFQLQLLLLNLDLYVGNSSDGMFPLSKTGNSEAGT